MTNERYTLDDLIHLMARLRDPDTGCSWDLKQTYSSIAKSTIEEAYEVVDAIESGDAGHLKEELGDLLFQVIFYSRLGQEEAKFDFHSIVHSLTEKLIRRHPHVFPNGSLTDVVAQTAAPEAVKASWEAIKKQERNAKGQADLLDDVPLGLPALTRAEKLQKRAASVGFDWQEPKQVLTKLQEEMTELQVALEAGDERGQKEELGDVLFTLVNLARHLDIDAETALRSANNKFSGRFRYIEQKVTADGGALKDTNVDLMERYWQEAKSRE